MTPSANRSSSTQTGRQGRVGAGAVGDDVGTEEGPCRHPAAGPPGRAGQRRLRKGERLRRRREYLAVQGQGRKVHLPHLLAFVLVGGGRFGITVSARVGNAVRRNRIKRLLREALRKHRDQVPGGYDIVLVAKKNAVAATLDELVSELAELGRRILRRRS